MIWQYINVAYPDVLNSSYGAYDIIRNAISSLVIVWPVLILVSWMIGKDMRADSERQTVRVRKWLMYLTLFIASIVVIVDLISLLNTFLNGEITIRFLLKVLTILAVAISVFSYYLWDLKRDASVKTKMTVRVAIISSTMIVLSIVGGFFLVGSPTHQRAIRMDNQRISDLQNIEYQILNHWTQKGVIPKTLLDLNDAFSGFTPPVDPITRQPYGYNLKGDHDFELCATFTKETSTEQTNRYKTAPMMYPYPEGKVAPDNWTHAAGTICFARSIDPELYRVQPPVVVEKK
ncbi:MAG: DUF5671 domain-containing protein, partial [Patescibacteria group bacterium]